LHPWNTTIIWSFAVLYKHHISELSNVDIEFQTLLHLKSSFSLGQTRDW